VTRALKVYPMSPVLPVYLRPQAPLIGTHEPPESLQRSQSYAAVTLAEVHASVDAIKSEPGMAARSPEMVGASVTVAPRAGAP
jgi:hypothetical protein